MAQWIEFREVPHTGKTKRWEVVTKDGGTVVGRISWYGPWRKYTLQPGYPTVWEQDCLRAIAEFIEQQTAVHKNKSSE